MPVLPKSLLVLGARLSMARTALRLRSKNSAVPAQKRAFRGLTRQLAKTSFGRAAGISGGMTYASFQKRVPLHTYEQLAPYIERMKRGEADVLWPGRCAFYAVSSGTAGPTKWIPVTFEMLAHFRRAGLESLLFYCVRTGSTKVFRGRHKIVLDSRKDYGEPRFITIGWLDGRMVVLVWTPTRAGRRVISMRTCQRA